MWWICVDKSSHMKRHYINANLCNQLTDDMKARSKVFSLNEDKSTFQTSIYFELGGMGGMFMNQPKMSFNVFDKKLSLDCDAVEDWIEKLSTSKRRTFADGTVYIKLYSRFCCLILSMPERESLLFQMRGKVKEAKKLSKEFFLELKDTFKKLTGTTPTKVPIILDFNKLKGLSNFVVDDDEPKE